MARTLLEVVGAAPAATGPFAVLSQYAPDPANTAAINSAIWNIFKDASPDKGGVGTASSSYWLTYEADDYSTSSLDHRTFAVVTDVDFRPGGTEEFLTTVTATPEPSAYFTMTSGLIGLDGLAYRRRRSSPS